MPLRATCKECGHVLYEGKELKSPDEIRSEYVKSDKCPQCGKKLSYSPIDVDVRPNEGYKRPSSKK